MSVNTLSIEQAYSFLNALHQEATGQQSSVQSVNSSNFVSVATATLATGYDNVLNAISQVLTRTIIAVRPYSAKFDGLVKSESEWGGIVRKINYLEDSAIAEQAYILTDGNSVDPWTINKIKVLETHYYGKAVYSYVKTITREQLKEAFSNPSNFATFISGELTHISNMWEQWFENLKRVTLLSFIAQKINNGDVIYLLDEYNTATGKSLTATSVRDPDEYPGFIKFAVGRVSQVSQMMTERSQLFQTQLTGSTIIRHTPKADQRSYFLSEFLENMRTEVKSDVYHDDYLNLNETEAVGYWQNIMNPSEIDVTAPCLDQYGAVTSTGQIAGDGILGVIFDRDAVGVNIFQNEVISTPLNARGLYYNLWHHAKVRLETDETEKGVVFALTANVSKSVKLDNISLKDLGVVEEPIEEKEEE